MTAPSGLQETNPMEEWLAVSVTDDPFVCKIDFQEHHIGNPIIRSVHGGVVGALIEYTAETALVHELRANGREAKTELTTSSIEYLRVTKDAPLFGRATIVRIARRIAFIDVWVWQDSEDLPVSRGSCTLRIMEAAKA
jgi:uncharacterized protein (TIGR00369 family)